MPLYNIKGYLVPNFGGMGGRLHAVEGCRPGPTAPPQGLMLMEVRYDGAP